MEFFILITLTLFALLVLAFYKYRDFFSKVMILGQLTNVACIVIVMLSSFSQRNMYVDIAIVYALLNFIGTKCLLNIVKEH